MCPTYVVTNRVLFCINMWEAYLRIVKLGRSLTTLSTISLLLAMLISVEQVEGLRYKLQMMGIPIDGSANIVCDNQTVFKNRSFPESTLKKKTNRLHSIVLAKHRLQ
jgi:hypothetical protein